MNVFKYSHTSFGEISGHPLTWELKDLSPILLTEKWFACFEFKKSVTGEGDNYVEYFENSKLTICNWGNGFIMSNAFSQGIRVELKFVHQLRNLFFSITGQELSIVANGS